MGLEFLRLRALHQPWQIQIQTAENNALNIFEVRKRSRETLRIFWSHQKNRPSLFWECGNSKFQDYHATSRATTEQTTRLNFGWLGPLPTLRRNQAHSLSVFIFCPKRPPWCSLIWYLIIDNLILVADKITYIYLLYLQSKAGGLIFENVCFHAMCTNAVSVSGWSPVGCEGFHTNVSIPSPLPTTLIFC